MAIARILDCCNAVVNNTPAGSLGANITRAYATIIGANLDDPATFISTPQVWVFPVGEDNTGIDRQSIQHSYEIGLVFASMYLVGGAIPQGDPTLTWLDSQSNYVESIFDALTVPSSPPGSMRFYQAASVQGSYYRKHDDPAQIRILYNTDDLLERKLFVANMQITYRDITGLTGT